MFSSAEHQVVYRIANAPIQYYPFPHIYVRDVFPEAFYRQIRQHLPPRSALKSLKALGRVTGDYPETRQVLPLTPADVEQLDEPYRTFWNETAPWLLRGRLVHFIMTKFAAFIEQRFADAHTRNFDVDALLVQDETNYVLDPHTDSPRKVLSFLFYLPQDDAKPHLGTSIYVPKDPSFECPGSTHWKPEGFEHVTTMPYLPNTLFAFLKTSQSFHGVERVQDAGVRRDLLLLDIQTDVSPLASPQQAKPAVNFSF